MTGLFGEVLDKNVVICRPEFGFAVCDDLCNISRGAFGEVGGFAGSNYLWSDDKSSSLKAAMHLDPEWKEIGRIMNVGTLSTLAIPSHVVRNVPVGLLFWYEMGILNKPRKIGHGTSTSSIRGPRTWPGIWDTAMREFSIPKAGYNGISG